MRAPRTVACLAAVAVVGSALAAAASPGSTGAFGEPFSQPGPPILYRAPAHAPQLQNTGIWHAKPILVSGTHAYRDGEYLYQDYLYDDHGARFTKDPNDPRGNNDFSAPNGTYTYPTGIANADAADFVEVRVKPLAHATAFRFTMNSLAGSHPDIGISVALGGQPGKTYDFPFGADTVAPADEFLTIHPAGKRMVVDVTNAGTEHPRAQLTADVDVTRRQITTLVPNGLWDPGHATARIAAAVGLWDGQHDRYLVPGQSATATSPGGAGLTADPSAFFNVAFRLEEPTPEFGAAIVEQVGNNPTWWRDSGQAAALASGDLTALAAEVDFGKLADRVTDNGDVPTTGNFDRILASHFEPHQGTRYDASCYGGDYDCQYQGRLQPYAIYIPKKAPPRSGYGMTLLLHANAANYNEFLNSRNAQQFGDRGTGSIVATPQARDPGSSYIGLAASDVFEVWADIARHYDLDPTWRTIAGYSLGGLGTFKLAEQFPDLFARAQPTVGASTDDDLIDSLRNIPVLMWNGASDELVGPEMYVPTQQRLDQLGYRYELDVFEPGEHNSLAINDEFDQAAAFLGDATVDRNPSHVTFVAKPSLYLPKLDYVADHAYWLSGVAVRDASAGSGRIDVISHGFGASEPDPTATASGAGTITGGYLLPQYPYTSQSKAWGPGPPGPLADVLDVSASNVRSVTVNAPRARVSCSAKLMLETDGPLDVVLAGCGGAAKLPQARRCVDRRKFTFRLHHAPKARVVRVAAYVNGKRVLVRRGHNLRRVTLKRLPRRRFTVRIVSTQSTGSKLVSVRRYKGCRKGRPHTRAHHHR